jgi:iron complex transport system substrate-binding protein
MTKNLAHKTMVLMGVALATPLMAEEVWVAEEVSVVSLDYCADQYVLGLADKSQILALTKGSIGADSFYKDRASDVPKFSATGPEVLALAPDVAIETWTANPNLKSLGSRVGTHVVSPQYGQGFEALFDNIQMISNALGQGQRGAEKVQTLKDNLAWLENQSKSPLTVAYITPSGYTAGTGTVVDDIIKLAGFKTYAEAQGLNDWQPLPLEDLVMNPPDVVLTSFYDTDMDTRSKWSLSRHPQIDAMLKALPRVDLPGKYLACYGLFAIDAAMKIRHLGTAQGLFKGKGESNE